MASALPAGRRDSWPMVVLIPRRLAAVAASEVGTAAGSAYPATVAVALGAVQLAGLGVAAVLPAEVWVAAALQPDRSGRRIGRCQADLFHNCYSSSQLSPVVHRPNSRCRQVG